MKLSTALETLAAQTFDFLTMCQAQGIAVTEDVITTNHLVFLKRNVPRTSVVWDARPWEKAIGCDFEMWVGSHAKGWRGYAVQAKRVDIASGRYQALAHSNAFGNQIDLLDRYAKWAGVRPLYLFYNAHIPATRNLCSSPYLVEQQGCTISPSSTVRTALRTRNGRTYRWIHASKSTALWRCLACPDTATCAHRPGHLPAPAASASLPARVRVALKQGAVPSERYEEYVGELQSKALVVIDISEDER